MNDSTKQKPVYKKYVRRGGLLLGCMFLLVFIPLVVLVVDEQVREVAEPVSYAATLRQSVAVIDDNIMAATETINAATAQESTLFSLPDISSWPDDSQIAARQWHIDVVKYYVEFIDLPVTTADMSYEDANKKFGEYFWKRKDINDKYRDKFPEDIRKKLTHAENRAFVNNICDYVLIDILVAHEKWDETATMYIEKDWDSEVYYWRKCGWKGKVTIAIRSVQRMWGALSVEEQP